MMHLGNVLVASGDASAGNELMARLRHAGYAGHVVTSAAQALAVARSDHPDLVIAGPTLDDALPVELGRRLKADPGCADTPVVVMTGGHTAEVCEEALDAGLDDVIRADSPEPVLLARLRPLFRLATMHAELHQRASVARGFGVLAGTQADRPAAAAAGCRLLAVGDDLSMVRQLLPDAEITLAGNLYEAEDLVSARNFDAAVLVVADSPAEHLDFCAQIRHNPRLFNLPVLLLPAEPGIIDVVEAYRRGASRVIAPPADPRLLRATILTLVRRQQWRWGVRQALQETLKAPTQDTLTAAYNRDFLLQYLEGRVAVARARKKHLSLMFFYVPNVDGVRQQFGDDAAEHLLQQLAQWISGLLRGEDMVARYQGNEFCVVLPDTPIEEADIVMHRIAGVLSYTDFAVRDVYQPIKVWVQVGSAGFQEGDDVPALLARARRHID